MALEAIRIDDDEFCFSTLDLIERSFAVTLPKDLRHIATAGDLFDEVTRLRVPSGKGERCDSAMVFYLLRRIFATVNPGKRIAPSAKLKDISALSPKALRRFLAEQTGLAMPQVEPTAIAIAFMLLTLPAALLMWWLVDAFAFVATAVAGVLFILADRGGFTGKWQSVRSLSLAIAQENVALLAEMGARDRPEDWWRVYTRILADAAEPVGDEVRPLFSRRIGRDTRIELI
jgi:hypothetical protein